MYKAVTHRYDLTVDERVLPIGDLIGDAQERRELREWAWLQLVGEGVKMLASAGRWSDAARHAHACNGIGVHLTEGRQAAIIACLINGSAARARALLSASSPVEPWERQVAACLHLLCTPVTDPLNVLLLNNAVARFREPTTAPGNASYRSRLGLTLAALTTPVRPQQAAMLRAQVAEEAIASGDGYAARDVLSVPVGTDGVTASQRAQLAGITTTAGLGTPLPKTMQRRLGKATDRALAILDTSLNALPTRLAQRSGMAANQASAPEGFGGLVRANLSGGAR